MGAALALSLVTTGCGNGGGESPGSAASPTKAQFLKRGNAICAKGSDEINRAYEKFSREHVAGGKEPSAALLDRAAKEIVLPVREEELRLIRALGTPQGEGQRVSEMLADWQEGIEKGARDPSSLRGGGPEFAFYKAYSMGIDYGLTKCWLG